MSDIRLQARRGFSLIELMVVVGIIAFVTAAVVPTFNLSLQRNRQREAGMLVVKALYAARSRAARLGKCHRVRILYRNPGVSGGTGGQVAVDSSTQASCGQAFNWGVWEQATFASVAVGVGPDGLNHAGLVGADVAITADDFSTGGELALHFEPSGGLWVQDARIHRLQVNAYDNGGNRHGISRAIRITPAGGAFYGTE